MKVKCENCKATLEVPYYYLGSAIQCPVCLCETGLHVGVNEPYSESSGDYVSYGDFLQLLLETEYRRVIAPLIERWFDCRAKLTQNAVRLQTKDGADLVLQYVHVAIQTDTEKRSILYRYAQSLWR